MADIMKSMGLMGGYGNSPMSERGIMNQPVGRIPYTSIGQRDAYVNARDYQDHMNRYKSIFDERVLQDPELLRQIIAVSKLEQRAGRGSDPIFQWRAKKASDALKDIHNIFD